MFLYKLPIRKRELGYLLTFASIVTHLIEVITCKSGHFIIFETFKHRNT